MEILILDFEEAPFQNCNNSKNKNTIFTPPYQAIKKRTLFFRAHRNYLRHEELQAGPDNQQLCVKIIVPVVDTAASRGGG